jgi:hypothetical protein
VGVRDALDGGVLAEPAQVVGGLADRDRSRAVGWAAEVFAEQATQVLIQEPAGVQPEGQQVVQQCLGARVGQASPATRVPLPWMTGSQAERRALSPAMGSWLSRWTDSSRRLAV